MENLRKIQKISKISRTVFFFSVPLIMTIEK